MAHDARKRQQKLERKNAKRKSKIQVLTRQQNASITERLEKAAKYPIVDCVQTGDIVDHGICSILLSRRLPNGAVATAGFLVDVYCLGVKDAWVQVHSNYEYLTDFADKIKHATRLTPAKARKLTEAAARYASSIGFQPHPDYRKARLIFGDINPDDCTEEFTFGKDGKPYFFAGPNDDMARVRQVHNTLLRTCGEGNFHCTIPIVPGKGILGMPDNIPESVRGVGYETEDDAE